MCFVVGLVGFGCAIWRGVRVENRVSVVLSESYAVFECRLKLMVYEKG